MKQANGQTKCETMPLAHLKRPTIRVPKWVKTPEDVFKLAAQATDEENEDAYKAVTTGKL